MKLATRNRLILAAPVIPALLTGLFASKENLTLAIFLAILTVITIRFIESQTRLVVKMKNRKASKIVNSDGDTNSLFE